MELDVIVTYIRRQIVYYIVKWHSTNTRSSEIKVYSRRSRRLFIKTIDNATKNAASLNNNYKIGTTYK